MRIFLFLLFITAFVIPSYAKDGVLPSWGNKHAPDDFQPYLEDEKHLQIPQWQDKNWYVEDWLAQKEPMDLMRGFYKADIIRNQKMGNKNYPVLVVGPNFYHLSGFDKRRVTQTIDKIYEITANPETGSYFIQDWNTGSYIGVFDTEGLRLH